MRRSERELAHAAKKTTRRSLLLGGAMSSVVSVLGFRMWQLGVRDAEQYYLLAEENRINIRLIPPALFAQLRQRAADLSQRPVSRAGAAAVILLWLAACAVTAWLAFP